ncbi:MAG: DUF881 domain-containing protein [Clostridia bacterium]|nr:DUF881 domain-containing protein [Clostridia bacterium]
MKSIKNVNNNESKIYLFIKENDVIPYSLIGITLLILSMLLTVQLKASSKENIYEGKRESELIEELKNLNEKYDNLEESYEEASRIIDMYSSKDGSDATISMMKSNIDNLSKVAGYTDVTGEGIIITLDDGEKLEEGSTRKDTLVHDSDVLTVVNELKVAGAEAISVNGERIISSSPIRCVGSVIQVNFRTVAAPFEIKAIGNSQYLYSAINIKNGVADLLKGLGIKVKVETKDTISIPKYDGKVTYRYAK